MKKIVSSLEGWDSIGGLVTVRGDLNQKSIVAERMMKSYDPTPVAKPSIRLLRSQHLVFVRPCGR